MRTVRWLSFLFLCVLCASAAFGQRAIGPGPARGGMNPGSRPTHLLPPRRFGPGFAAFPALPAYFDDYDYGYAPAVYQPPAPPPQPPVVIVQEPPPIVRSEIREYKQLAPNEPAAAQEQPAYALALRDGSVRSAVAVVVQQNGLLYVDPDGRHELVSLDAVDRETTRKLNQERKLRLQLPVPNR